MTTHLTTETVARMADLAGHALADAEAARVARAIGPALAAFSPVEATLPFEAEPAGFLAAQREERS